MKEFSTEPQCFQEASAFFQTPPPFVIGEAKHWRMKAKLAVRGTALDPRIGLFHPGSHEIQEILDCPAHHPSINQAQSLLLQEMKHLRIEPYDEKQNNGEIRYAQFFVSRENRLIQLVIVARQKQGAQKLASALWSIPNVWHSIWINIQPKVTNCIFGDEWLHCFGEEFLIQSIGRGKIAFHPGAFAQANLGLFDHLLERLDGWISPGARLLEVYAGAGAISLHLAARLKSALLVESNPYAYLSYCRSAPPTSFQYFREEANQAGRLLERVDCVVVDPPRKGLDPQFLNVLRRCEEKRLIYVSCSYESFQRDARELMASGWTIDDAAIYWMFPGTNHVEIAALMKKSG